MKTNKRFLLAASVSLALAFTPFCAFAQSEFSITGNANYVKMVLDDAKDYPFTGFGFSFQVLQYIPLNDNVKIGGSGGVSYVDVSAEDEYNVELAISQLNIDAELAIRFCKEKNEYMDVGFQMSFPISEDATVKAPGYGTQKLDTEKSETSFALSISGRYNVLGVSIGKVLTGSDKPIVLGAQAFLSLSEQFELVPNIGYAIGDTGSQLNIGAGFQVNL
jgi:hypothetical protein